MKEQLEQRYCIKFCQKLGKSQVETIQKIHTAFDDVTVEAFHIARDWSCGQQAIGISITTMLQHIPCT
jgi:hypothetical protein